MRTLFASFCFRPRCSAWGSSCRGMVDPAKVLAFLDVAGDWDPSLAFVMGGAIPVAAAGFFLARRRACGRSAPGGSRNRRRPASTRA